MTEKPNRIFVRQKVSNEYTVRFTRDITDIDDFDDELNLLASAGPDDVVKFIIVSDGGSLLTTSILVKALNETEAHTIGFIGGNCCSGATAVALACDEWEIDDHSQFMIHTATMGMYGKTNELKAQYNSRVNQVERFIDITYTGFLTPEEIEECKGGKDFWFEAEELADRLNRYAEYRTNSRKSIQVIDMQGEEE